MYDGDGIKKIGKLVIIYLKRESIDHDDMFNNYYDILSKKLVNERLLDS